MYTSLGGKIERRLALVILFTGAIPLGIAVYLANALFKEASAFWFNPEVGRHLDQGILLYKAYVQVIKEKAFYQAEKLWENPSIQKALLHQNQAAIQTHLDPLFDQDPNLVGVRVLEGDQIHFEFLKKHMSSSFGKRVFEVRKTFPLNPRVTLIALFSLEQEKFEHFAAGGAFVSHYHGLVHSRSELYQGYIKAFALLLGITILVTCTIGVLFAQGITRRISRLSQAMASVTKGDWSVRVPITGSDEMTELARFFNHMLDEMRTSHARIEYLMRLGAWQDIAKRLAHEIKNPLTPIQLAVQECHRQYTGNDPKYSKILNMTLEIVEEEIGILRRLVETFSNFARMPQAEVAPVDIGDFLRECAEQWNTYLETEDSFLSLSKEPTSSAPIGLHDLRIQWNISTRPMPTWIDHQMLRGALINLIRNAVEATQQYGEKTPAPSGEGQQESVTVRIHATPRGRQVCLHIEDSGPGIDPLLIPSIFEPYMTTKPEGTGLGLAIVKKIIMEHGGSIDVSASKNLGGACFTILLPMREDKPQAEVL
ncbi:HAMP domain-containing histidine kinase [Pajaroellobacter abortibovis]|uniref:histidine kinase n=1 Tax=Pajaroellobacter abortibovis TaxID=1882918 RepID=A0A1L6MUR7_9BACT|nr:HAMP domain-containing histidine kinase [Pajaroellobacter abortibovis]APR99264.1 hypothetical protein BCY86_00180 [Pajaroellobacter abortibovis]